MLLAPVRNSISSCEQQGTLPPFFHERAVMATQTLCGLSMGHNCEYHRNLWEAEAGVSTRACNAGDDVLACIPVSSAAIIPRLPSCS